MASAAGQRPSASQRRATYAANPLLASPTPLWRARLIVILVGLAFAGLIVRATYIQVWGASFYVQEGDKRVLHTMELQASRGRVVDRNGQMLAASVAAPSIWAIPREIDANREQKRQLARSLGMTAEELERKLAEHPRFVWLTRQADEPTAKAVKTLALKGVHEAREYRRRYPEGEAAAHVVGFTNLDDRGQEGVELAFQRELQGTHGNRAVVKDRLGRVIDHAGETVDAIDGRDVQLSLDSKVQFIAFQRLREAVQQHRAKSGSAVVLDAKTGEVLALANYPSFDPTKRDKREGDNVRNRALTDTFEPGSTIKPFVAALALQTGRVTPDTLLDVRSGSLTVGGLTIRDSASADRKDQLTVAQVVQRSSNIGTVRMAMEMPAREMWELYSQLGFGQRPDLQFPGAVSGRLRPHKSWKPIEQATMSYGYGLSASLFQLARAYTVFARDGEILPVSMIKQSAPVAGVRVIDADTARRVRSMLQAAAAVGGTARKAQTIGYSVGGKTGTAYKQEGKGYANDKYRAWFVGVSPINDPRIVVAVMVDEPTGKQHYGGDVAAPVFSQIVQQTLQMMAVSPDIEVTPQIIGTTAAASGTPATTAAAKTPAANAAMAATTSDTRVVSTAKASH
jgi:cell division protein FtsI (penicillin-binding protein 3)